jgi:hypothetical protein
MNPAFEPPPEGAPVPTFLVIGAQKAGTTALYYHLRNHPEIFMSRNKEPGFFAQDPELLGDRGPGDLELARGRVTDPAEYLALFAPGEGAEARGECSTVYLYSADSPRAITRWIPDVKLVAILRDPIERAFSSYLHMVRDGHESLPTFREALNAEAERLAQGWSAAWAYRSAGQYGVQISRFLEVFPREQISIYRYEDFNADPASVMADLYAFLGVSADVQQDLGLRIHVGGIPRSRRLQAVLQRSNRVKWAVDPFVPPSVRRRLLKWQAKTLERPSACPETRAYLAEFYRPDVARLAELTGMNFEAWLVEGDR